jgi:hypothetical protein
VREVYFPTTFRESLWIPSSLVLHGVRGEFPDDVSGAAVGHETSSQNSPHIPCYLHEHHRSVGRRFTDSSFANSLLTAENPNLKSNLVNFYNVSLFLLRKCFTRFKKE